eukprot:g61307.t1
MNSSQTMFMRACAYPCLLCKCIIRVRVNTRADSKHNKHTRAQKCRKYLDIHPDIPYVIGIMCSFFLLSTQKRLCPVQYAVYKYIFGIQEFQQFSDKEHIHSIPLPHLIVKFHCATTKEFTVAFLVSGRQLLNTAAAMHSCSLLYRRTVVPLAGCLVLLLGLSLLVDYRRRRLPLVCSNAVTHRMLRRGAFLSSLSCFLGAGLLYLSAVLHNSYLNMAATVFLDATSTVLIIMLISFARMYSLAVHGKTHDWHFVTSLNFLLLVSTVVSDSLLLSLDVKWSRACYFLGQSSILLAMIPLSWHHECLYRQITDAYQPNLPLWRRKLRCNHLILLVALTGVAIVAIVISGITIKSYAFEDPHGHYYLTEGPAITILTLVFGLLQNIALWFIYWYTFIPCDELAVAFGCGRRLRWFSAPSARPPARKELHQPLLARPTSNFLQSTSTSAGLPTDVSSARACPPEQQPPPSDLGMLLSAVLISKHRDPDEVVAHGIASCFQAQGSQGSQGELEDYRKLLKGDLSEQTCGQFASHADAFNRSFRRLGEQNTEALRQTMSLDAKTTYMDSATHGAGPCSLPANVELPGNNSMVAVGSVSREDAVFFPEEEVTLSRVSGILRQAKNAHAGSEGEFVQGGPHGIQLGSKVGVLERELTWHTPDQSDEDDFDYTEDTASPVRQARISDEDH